MILNFLVRIEGDANQIDYIKQTLATHIHHARVLSIDYEPLLSQAEGAWGDRYEEYGGVPVEFYHGE